MRKNAKRTKHRKMRGFWPYRVGLPRRGRPWPDYWGRSVVQCALGLVGWDWSVVICALGFGVGRGLCWKVWGWWVGVGQWWFVPSDLGLVGWSWSVVGCACRYGMGGLG